MKIKRHSDDYLLVYNEGDVDVKMLMGWKNMTGSLWLKVEDNLVNRIVLGLPILTASDTAELKCSPMDKLIEYQISDIKKLLGIPNSLNANPMGLGKTLETIMYLKEKGLKENILILCPKSVVYQWSKEIEKWWPEASENVDVLPIKIQAGRIVIMNYEKAATKTVQPRLQRISWKQVVCDEVHRIKNRKSNRTLMVIGLSTQRKMGLSGTPIMNRPDDLWSILHWLDWRYAGKSYWTFVNYFCEVEDGFFGKSIKGITQDAAKVAILNKIIDTIGVRNPSNITQGKTIEVVPLKMMPVQKKLYDKAKKLLIDELPENLTIANGAVLMTRLQQITGNPQMFSEKCSNVKFDWVAEFLEDHPEEKIVVFTRFAETLKALQKRLGERMVMMHGQMRSEERSNSVQKFQSDTKVRVIGGTIGAMGTGVDGLQHVSRIAVFIDRDWSPSQQEQAEDRLNRMGQKDRVLIYYLDCMGTVDKYVGQVTLKKSEDIIAILGD